MATNTTVRDTKGIPSVPDVPPKLDIEGIYRILEPLTRIINIRQGKFDALDRWVTQQDLVDIGVTTETAVSSPVVVIPPTSVYDFVLDGDIIGGPTAMGTGQPTITMQTAIDLPNVVCIDGGDAAETYPGAVTGPYGVQTGGAGVPDGGTVGQYLIKQSATDGDAIWEEFGGVAGANESYCPGYNYSRVDDNEFTVDLADAENLFYIGRRVRFDKAGVFTYGAVNAVDFNITSANDTHVTLTMEGVETVPTDPFEACLVTAATAWSPIATDPFAGNAINDIATGSISGTQWWVAVGDGGRLFTSNDAGATWTVRTTGTTENLNCVAYDLTNDEFMAGGNLGVILESSDGSTWSLDTTSILAIVTTGTGDIDDIAWSPTEGDWVAFFDYSTNNKGIGYKGLTATAGVWNGIRYQLSKTAGWNGRFRCLTHASSALIWVPRSTDDVGNLSNVSDTSSTSLVAGIFATSNGASFGWAGGINLEIGANRNWAVTNSLGDIVLYNQSSESSRDDVTFSFGFNDFIYSTLHARIVGVGLQGQIGYLDAANFLVDDAWTSVANGFDVTTTINAVEFNETDGVFVAVAENGQICRSSNGTS